MFVRQINDDDDEERKRKKRIFARAVRSFRPTSCLAAAVGLFRSASDGSVTCERQRTSTTTFWCGARRRRSSSQGARSFDAVRSSIIDGHGRRIRGGDAGLRRPHVGKPVAATPIFSPPHGRLTTEIRETARNDPTQKRTNYLLQLSVWRVPAFRLIQTIDLLPIGKLNSTATERPTSLFPRSPSWIYREGRWRRGRIRKGGRGRGKGKGRMRGEEKEQ